VFVQPKNAIFRLNPRHFVARCTLVQRQSIYTFSKVKCSKPLSRHADIRGQLRKGLASVFVPRASAAGKKIRHSQAAMA
jgi:hypothetical protein